MTTTSDRRTVSVHRRLRPVRLAFLVGSNDGKTLRKVIEANTCLWGGRFNGIIPVFQRTPSWWADHPYQQSSASEIRRGYLSAFEPDYVVAADPRFADDLDLEKARIIELDDVLSATRASHVGCGLSVTEVYRDLYQREFQFLKRRPPRIAVPSTPDPRLSRFIAACFGAFPSDSAFEYFPRDFGTAFDPEEISVDGTNLLNIFMERVGTPLAIGSAGLEVRRRAWSSGPTLFFMDGTKARDLIDFWNLRALGWTVLPVPQQWSGALVDSCRQYVEETNTNVRHNPQVRKRPTLLRSRSSTNDEVKAFAKRVLSAGNNSIVYQRSYPRLWDDWARDKDHAERCDVIADERDTESTLEGRKIAFRLLTPGFAERFASTDKARWVNVVQIRDFWPSGELALVFPPGLKSVDRVLRTLEQDTVSVSTEGLILRCRHHDWTHRWTLPDGLALFRHWLDTLELTAKPSGAGQIAREVIRCLGGPLGARVIADVEIVKLLDKMAHGLVEIPTQQEPDVGQKPPARSRLTARHQWIKMLKVVNRGNGERAERHFATLVDRGVLRVGLELRCPTCAQANWLSSGASTDVLQCQCCLRDLPFPAANPPANAWRYRTQGPFSVENYAQGAYTTALALRFLTTGLSADATWVTGLEIGESEQVFGEVDFGAWWRPESAFDGGEPSLLLGECKSFGPFEAKDVKRAGRLAERFPGTTLVFATLREELARDEKKRLAALARAGRKRVGTEKWKAPVLVLTCHELTSDMGPPSCWHKAGGRFAKFAAGFKGYGGLHELCDATQKLHLDMDIDDG